MGDAQKTFGNNLKLVIFCGGYGTRMWPMSREKFPKQFQPIFGDKSLFQLAAERVKKGFSPEEIFFSIPKEQSHFLRKQAPWIKEKNIITEPERRDTLGAVSYVAAWIDKKFPGSLMATLWGDHLIKDEKRFLRLIRLAAKITDEDNVFTKIDVKPEYPSTALGWTKIGKVVKKVGGYSLYSFEQHVEKPKLEIAKKMMKHGSYLFNTGYCISRPSQLLHLLKKYNPNCFEHIEKIQKAIGMRDEDAVLAREYSKIEKISIDYGLFEKLPPDSFGVFCGDIGWKDVGTWDLLYEALAVGQRQNITQGKVEIIDSAGNLVYIPKDKVAAVIGVENLVVVDTADGLLICKRGKGGDIKKFIKILKEKEEKQYL